jgi:hypothetical protein
LPPSHLASPYPTLALEYFYLCTVSDFNSRCKPPPVVLFDLIASVALFYSASALHHDQRIHAFLFRSWINNWIWATSEQSRSTPSSTDSPLKTRRVVDSRVRQSGCILSRTMPIALTQTLHASRAARPLPARPNHLLSTHVSLFPFADLPESRNVRHGVYKGVVRRPALRAATSKTRVAAHGL